jgi:hypothetical protein
MLFHDEDSGIGDQKSPFAAAGEQDVIGAVLLALTEEEWTRIGELDAETRAAIREGLEQAERGEFVPDDEIEALWVRLGL